LEVKSAKSFSQRFSLRRHNCEDMQAPFEVWRHAIGHEMNTKTTNA